MRAYLILTIAALGSLATSTLAGPNAGGTLILHANPEVIYTSDTTNYCGQSGLADCALVIATVPANPLVTSVFYAMAAFPEGSSPRLAAACFGVEYDSEELVLLNRGHCGDFEMVTETWPASGSGTALKWNVPKTTHLVEVYWFAGYAYSATAPTVFELTPHPVQGGNFADDAVPSVIDSIAGYGCLGFGTVCLPTCPEEGGEDNPGGDGPQGGEEDGPGEGDMPEGFDPPMYLNTITMKVKSSAILFETTSGDAVAPMEAMFLSPALRSGLSEAGAVSVRKLAPWKLAADTLVTDRRENLVRVPDLSRFFVVHFDSPEAAALGLAAAHGIAGISYASHDYASPVMVIDDPIFTDSDPAPPWPGPDVQWYLRNQGLRDDAVTGADLDPPFDWYNWPLGDAEDYLIGLVDVGIPDSLIAVHDSLEDMDHHEDLLSLPLTEEEKAALSSHWDSLPNPDYCGDHASRMAGIAGARTGNGLGMAGVCPGCRFLDLESCHDRPGGDPSTCALRNCGVLADYGDKIIYATDHWKYDLRAFLLETGFAGYFAGYDLPVVLFAAYKLGIVTVTPSGDQRFPIRRPVSIASIPFVIGAGGFTFRDRFWGADFVCETNPSKGTTVGYGNVDICGPACPWTYSAGPDTLNPYGWTSMQNSGSAAAVAGVAVWQQLFAETIMGEWALTADDWSGMLINSARPFAEDPVPLYGCAECTAEDFGHGILSMDRLATLILNFDIDRFRVHEVRYGDEATEFAPVGIVMESHFPAPTKKFRLWRLRAFRVIPQTGNSNLAKYIAWPNHYQPSPLWQAPDSVTTTTTPLFYGPTDNDLPNVVARDYQMNFFESSGVTACFLTLPTDQGGVELSGYTVEALNDDLSHHSWLFPPEDMVMSFTCYSETSIPAGIEGAIEKPSPRLVILGSVSEGKVQIVWNALRRGRAQLEVVDVAGRLVWSQEIQEREGTAGPKRVTWDGRDRSGQRVGSGIYWIRLRTDGTSQAGKLVVVR